MKPRPIFVTLPPSVHRNSWPWSKYVEEYKVPRGHVTKWGEWHYKVEISWPGRTAWFRPWHYTSGPEGCGPGMYGSIEQRDVIGLCLLRRIVIMAIRARFAESTGEPAE